MLSFAHQIFSTNIGLVQRWTRNMMLSDFTVEAFVGSKVDLCGYWSDSKNSVPPGLSCAFVAPHFSNDYLVLLWATTIGLIYEA